VARLKLLSVSRAGSWWQRHPDCCAASLHGAINASRHRVTIVFGPTILIVDDHEDGRDMLVEYFRSRAYSTIAADAAQIAARICRDSAPAIVVVDLSLPTLEAACQLIRTIKHRHRSVAPYIVGLNGWGFVQQAAPAIAAGCSVVIAKPIELPVLMAAVTIGLAAYVGGCSAA
jgi:CheY-like chemotaxis protein